MSAGVGQRCIDVLGVELRGLELWVGMRIQKFLQGAREGCLGKEKEGYSKQNRRRRRSREEAGRMNSDDFD